MGNVIAAFRNISYPRNRETGEEQEFRFLKKMEKKARVMKSEEEAVFPVEVMMEIISWLPLKPLARAQLVCKQWRSLIQEHTFMEKHMCRSPYLSNWCKRSMTHTHRTAPAVTSTASYLHGCDGLLLVRNKISNLHLIWNPASRLVLHLPTPQNSSRGFALCFVPSTKNYKVASFFKDKDSKTLGCEILTLGPSMEWRRLEFPDQVYQKGNQHARVVPAGGAVHCVVLSKKGKENAAEIVSLDLETELLTVNLLPGGLFGDATEIDCDGRLGFAVLGKQEAQVMVLQDYKKNIWCSNKVVIPLPFLNDKGFEGKNLFVLLIRKGEVWFSLKDNKIFVYTIETGKRSDARRCRGFYSFSRKVFSYKPSLVHFRGMRPDADDSFLHVHGPRNIPLD